MKSLPLLSFFLLGLAGCASAPEPGFSEAMDKAVHSHAKEFQGCYRKFGDRKKVRTCLHYHLAFSGEIQFCEIDADCSIGSSPEMRACILEEFKTIKLPEVVGYKGARGTYTFNYTFAKEP